MTARYRIGIVGGSIAGTSAAVLLLRQGHEVTVFERSGSLEERGGGVGLPPTVVERLRDVDLIAPTTRGVPARARIWCAGDGVGPVGRLLHSQPMDIENHHWGLLHRELLARAGDTYRHGAEVVEVADVVDGARVRLVDGTAATFDVVLGADGYRSATRRTAFPDAVAVYAGYPAWRGILDESDVADIAPVDEALQSPVTPHGHGAFYLVPGRDGEIDRRRRRLNWLWYDAGAPDDVLRARHTDGRTDVEAVPPGRLSPEQVAYLRAIAHEQLPPWHRDVVLGTAKPYMQPLYDLELDHYVRGRVCLLGDAASIARPHTASGTTKAFEDALAVAGAFADAASCEEALARYDAERAAAGVTVVRLGRRLGQQHVVDVPDWSHVDEEGFATWLAGTAAHEVYAFSGDEERRGA